VHGAAILHPLPVPEFDTRRWSDIRPDPAPAEIGLKLEARRAPPEMFIIESMQRNAPRGGGFKGGAIVNVVLRQQGLF
jgi:hypothetical protein